MQFVIAFVIFADALKKKNMIFHCECEEFFFFFLWRRKENSKLDGIVILS